MAPSIGEVERILSEKSASRTDQLDYLKEVNPRHKMSSSDRRMDTSIVHSVCSIFEHHPRRLVTVEDWKFLHLFVNTMRRPRGMECLLGVEHTRHFRPEFPTDSAPAPGIDEDVRRSNKPQFPCSSLAVDACIGVYQRLAKAAWTPTPPPLLQMMVMQAQLRDRIDALLLEFLAANRDQERYLPEDQVARLLERQEATVAATSPSASSSS